MQAARSRFGGQKRAHQRNTPWERKSVRQPRPAWEDCSCFICDVQVSGPATIALVRFGCAEWRSTWFRDKAQETKHPVILFSLCKYCIWKSRNKSALHLNCYNENPLKHYNVGNLADSWWINKWATFNWRCAFHYPKAGALHRGGLFTWFFKAKKARKQGIKGKIEIIIGASEAW
jgi:hypothetical protein